MAAPGKTLELRTSPHLLSGYSVDTIMFNVVVALAPAVAFAIYAFGWAAVAVLGTATATCVATEGIAGRVAGKRSTLGDWSAARSRSVDVPAGMTDVIHTPNGDYLLNGQAVRFALGQTPDPFALVRFTGF